MKTIESYLPVFPGFYGTQFESDIAEENTMYNLVEDDGLDITYDDINWDYKDYMERVAYGCISSVQNYLEHDGFSIEIDFEKVYSPREYNFGNDVAYCTYKVNDEDFNNLLDYLKANISEFKTYIDDKYSSRSGFISFFDTDLDTWFNEYLQEGSDKFERAFAGILEFYLTNEGYTDYEMADDCQDELSYIDYEIKALKVDSSRNYNHSFRKVIVEGKKYLCWFIYQSELFLKGQSKLLIEQENGEGFSKIVDVNFDGTYDKKERYDFFNQNSNLMEKEVLAYHNNIKISF